MSGNRKIARVATVIVIALAVLSILGCGFLQGVVDRSQQESDAIATYSTWDYDYNNNIRVDPTATAAKK